jgi:hypothetical protein
MELNTGLRLPVQAAVSREFATGQGYENSAGVEAAQSACDNLTGLAQQMCYAVVYDVDI